MEMCNAGSSELHRCADSHYKNKNHNIILDDMFNKIIGILQLSAQSSEAAGKSKPYKVLPGWNKHVKTAYEEAQLAFQMWQFCDKPDVDFEFEKMRNIRRVFKSNF